jgi:hypothetical protein
VTFSAVLAATLHRGRQQMDEFGRHLRYLQHLQLTGDSIVHPKPHKSAYFTITLSSSSKTHFPGYTTTEFLRIEEEKCFLDKLSWQKSESNHSSIFRVCMLYLFINVIQYNTYITNTTL